MQMTLLYPQSTLTENPTLSACCYSPRASDIWLVGEGWDDDLIKDTTQSFLL